MQAPDPGQSAAPTSFRHTTPSSGGFPGSNTSPAGGGGGDGDGDSDGGGEAGAGGSDGDDGGSYDARQYRCATTCPSMQESPAWHV